MFPIVVTDIDGTLLDHDTYGFAPALPAIRLLEREGIPLVLCSSRTRAEIAWLQAQIGIRHPFVTENGGALFWPAGYFPFLVRGARSVDGHQAIEFGRPYHETVTALRSAAAALGLEVTGFNDMSAAEIARRCGLTLAEAQRARQREYDEPFATDDRNPAACRQLFDRLQRAGLRCSQGGRFAHVTGLTDKARPTRVLRMLYRRANRRRVVTFGLGDAPNDACLLREVDIPIVIRNPAAGLTAELLAAVPCARVSREMGPRGWRQAVEEVVVGSGLNPPNTNPSCSSIIGELSPDPV